MPHEPDFDFEAEDAWDASDDLSTHIDNLLERLDEIEHIPSHHEPRSPEHLDEVERRLRALVRRRDLDEHTLVRLALLADDLIALRAEP